MTLDEARKSVAAYAKEHEWPDCERAREIELGWYFPWRFSDDEPRLGSKGLIVDKRTGKVMELGSAYTLICRRISGSNPFTTVSRVSRM